MCIGAGASAMLAGKCLLTLITMFSCRTSQSTQQSLSDDAEGAFEEGSLPVPPDPPKCNWSEHLYHDNKNDRHVASYYEYFSRVAMECAKRAIPCVGADALKLRQSLNFVAMAMH